MIIPHCDYVESSIGCECTDFVRFDSLFNGLRSQRKTESLLLCTVNSVHWTPHVVISESLHIKATNRAKNDSVLNTFRTLRILGTFSLYVLCVFVCVCRLTCNFLGICWFAGKIYFGKIDKLRSNMVSISLDNFEAFWDFFHPLFLWSLDFRK